MLTLITPSGGVPLRVDDYYIKELASGLDELCFSISIWDEQYQAIQEESSIFEQSDGKSAYYLVKAIDGGVNTANIKCQIDLDEWRETFNLAYDSGTPKHVQIFWIPKFKYIHMCCFIIANACAAPSRIVNWNCTINR